MLTIERITVNRFILYKWTQLFKIEIERNKPKKLFVHDNSMYLISLIKDFNIKRAIYV